MLKSLCGACEEQSYAFCTCGCANEQNRPMCVRACALTSIWLVGFCRSFVLYLYHDLGFANSFYNNTFVMCAARFDFDGLENECVYEYEYEYEYLCIQK